MVDYEKMYKVLFNGITDAIGDMEQQNFGFAKLTLMETQQVAEEIFQEAGEPGQIIMSLKAQYGNANKPRGF